MPISKAERIAIWAIVLTVVAAFAASAVAVYVFGH